MSALDNIDLTHVFLLGKKTKKLFSIFSNKLRESYDLKNIDLGIIFYLDKHRDASIGEISRNMYLNKGQLSQAIQNLKDTGYIHTEKDENDQRYTYYRLTDKSEDLLLEIKKLTDYSRKVLFDGLTEEEQKTYCTVIKQIGNNIDKLEKEFE